MGRVVLEAAERYAFRRVVGVELVPEFARAAEALLRRNAARLRASGWEIVVADAAGYRVPDDVTVVYLYDPFTGGLFDAVVDELGRSLARRPRRLRILYLAPTESSRLERLPGLAVTTRGTTNPLRRGTLHVYQLAEVTPAARTAGGSPAAR